MAFNGQYEHSLDAKHRLSLPARFRSSFDERFFLSMDTDPCINVAPAHAHDARLQGALAGKNPLGTKYKQIQRYFRGNSWEVELDGAGRVTLPAKLREHAGIGKEVIVAGVDDHLELWSPEGWDTQQEALSHVMGEVTDSLDDPS